MDFYTWDKPSAPDPYPSATIRARTARNGNPLVLPAWHEYITRNNILQVGILLTSPSLLVYYD